MENFTFQLYPEGDKMVEKYSRYINAFKGSCYFGAKTLLRMIDKRIPKLVRKHPPSGRKRVCGDQRKDGGINIHEVETNNNATG
jgi:hypothetical protein